MGLGLSIMFGGGGGGAGVAPPAAPTLSGLPDLSVQTGTGVTVNCAGYATGSGLIWTMTGPAELSINQLTGQITGTAGAAGTGTVTVTAANGGGSASDSFAMTVTASQAGETHVFLVAGQSNATDLAGWDGGVDWPSNVYQLSRSGLAVSHADKTIIPAARPLDHWTGVPGGFGWSLQFVLDYVAANPGVNVMLIPTSCAGTGFVDNRWIRPDALQYSSACTRGNLVMSSNPGWKFKGILWHQGENDAQDASSVAAYQALFDAAMNGFRTDISGASAAPIVIGQIPQQSTINAARRDQINAIIDDTPNRIGHLAVASSAGMTIGDAYHFNAASMRTMGHRYYQAYLRAVAGLPSAPGKVLSLSVVSGDGQATLSWAAPSNGGAAITDYLIEVSTNGGASWSTVSDGTSPGTSYTHTGLANGTAYTYRVSAINSAGTGPVSDTASATPTGSVTAPGQVTGLTATSADSAVMLSWVAPSNGGSAITDYLIEVNSGSGWSTVADGTSTATSYTHSGLTNGTAYTYRVSAINAIGTGAASATASATPDTSILEAGATGHWLLGSDNPTHAGLTGGALTVVNSGVASIAANNVTIRAVTSTGLRSGISQTADMTLCAVVKTSTNNIIVGNMVSGAPGFGAYYAGTYYAQGATAGGAHNLASTESGGGVWKFIAVTISGGTTAQIYARGSGSAAFASGSAAASVAANALAIGPVFWTNGAFCNGFSVAEAIFFDTAKTQAELDAIYSRTVSRMSARGITLGSA